MMQGIDKAIGMHSTQGNEALLNRLLVKFRDSNRDFVEIFAQMISDDRLEEAQRMAHTLKSTSASLGVTEVNQAALKLEMACKENAPTIDHELAHVNQTLTVALQSLDKL